MGEFMTMGGGGVPAGSYSAEFLGAFPWEGNSEFGPALQLRWKVVGGEWEGSESSRIASKKLTPKSTLGKFAVAVKGGKIEAGEAFSFATHLGCRGVIVVEATDSGATRVATFIRQ